MKIKTLFVAVFSFAAAAVVYAADPAPLIFNGVLTLSKEQHFGLMNADGSKTTWAKLGGEFDGYTLKSYDAATHTLTLERDGQTHALRLVDSKISGDFAPAEKATLEEAQAMVEGLQLEKMLEKTIEGQTVAMEKMMRRGFGGKGPATEEEIEFQKKVMAVMLESINAEQMKTDLAQIYADTFTKEELQAVVRFNSTPIGQALIEKQPQIQQRLQELMMPRIMSAMPKIQQMGMEFSKAQKAKRDAAAGAQGATGPATPSAPAPKPSPSPTPAG